MKQLLYALPLLALGACGRSGPAAGNHLLFNDFESLDGWTGGGPSPSLTKEKAHSGVYSLKVDPAVEYSQGYANVISRLSPNRADVSQMTLHGWVFVPNDKNFPQVVLELTNPDGKQVQREAVDLHQKAAAKGYNQWIEFSQPVTLAPAATELSQLKLYVWRGNSPDAIYVDDLSLDKTK